MKPIIFQFRETPTPEYSEEFDYSLIEYDEKLNLSIHKELKIPAIDVPNIRMDTVTVTYPFRSNSREETDADSPYKN